MIDIIDGVAGYYKGEPELAWTYIVCSIIYLFATHFFVSMFIDTGDYNNITFAVIQGSMCQFLFFAAMVEKRRCIVNGTKNNQQGTTSPTEM